jgi:hypothetical protein
MKFYAYLYGYLYGSMGPQHCIHVVDVRKITTYIYLYGYAMFYGSMGPLLYAMYLLKQKCLFVMSVEKIIQQTLTFFTEK